VRRGTLHPSSSGTYFLRSSHSSASLASHSTGEPRRWLLRPFTRREWGLHVVVLDKDTVSWFIADSSLRAYDGSQVVREERSVGQKKLVRKAEPPSNRRIAWPRWTGFRGMTLRDWLPIVGALLIPVVIAAGTWGITWQQGKI
jgi:hypothetical protein